MINSGLDGTAFFEGLEENERNTIYIEGTLVDGSTRSISRNFATGI